MKNAVTDNDIFNAQIKLLYQQLPYSLVSTTLLSLLLVWAMLDIIPFSQLLTWAMVLLLVTAGRYWLYRSFSTQLSQLKSLNNWNRWFSIGTALASISWSSLVLFHQYTHSTYHQFIIIFVLAGMCIASISTLSAQRQAMLLFLVPILLSITLVELLQTNIQHIQIGTFLLVFSVSITAVALHWHRSVKQMLLTQEQNKRLQKYLESGKRDIQTSKERLHRAQSFTQVGTWEWDVKTGIMTCSEYVRRVLGCDPAMPIIYYDDFVKNIYKGDTENVINAHRAIIDDKPQNDIEYRYIWPDGSMRWIHSHGELVRDEESGAVCILGLLRDISQQKSSEEELRKGKAEFEAIFNSISDAIVFVDASRKIITINPALTRMFGYTLEDLSGHTTKLLYADPAEYHNQGKKRYGVNADRKAVNVAYEMRYTRKDGSEFIGETMGGEVKDSNGVTLGFVGIVRNVAERKKAEETLNQFKTSLDLTNDCVFMFYPDSLKFFYVNKGAIEQVGYSAEELLTMTAIDIKPNFTTETFRELISSLYGEKSYITFETYHRHKNGELIPVEIFLQYISPTGEPARFVAIVRDITERKVAERNIEDSNRMLQKVLDTIPVRVFWKNTELKYIGCNRNFAHDAGLDDPYDIIGKDDFEMPWKNQADVYQADDRQVMDSGNSKIEYEEQQTSNQGEVDWLLTSKIPLRSRDSKIFGVLGVYENITHRKLAEQEKNRLRQQLLQAQKMESIGQLTGGIAHDFNNLLAGILGYSDLALELCETDKDSKLDNFLQQIRTAGIRGRDLVAQLMAFSRTTPGKPEPMLIAPAVDEAINILRATLPTNIELITECEDDLPCAMMDRVQLSQLVLNLCINARDAMHTSGGGRISINTSKKAIVDALCSSCHSDISGSYIEICVSDTGVGINPEILRRIFEPFYTTKDVDKGTGMGLSMVHGIVHEHEGHIIVNSEQDHGTTFSILLPVIEDITPTEKPVIEPVSILGSHEAKMARALVVDDEESIGLFLAELLKMNGYDVTLETDSEAALQKFQNNPQAFDIIVTDQTMPQLTGLQLADEIHAITPEFPVIICTGYSEMLDADIAKQHGVKGFLGKPIDTKKLLTMMHELLATSDLQA